MDVVEAVEIVELRFELGWPSRMADIRLFSTGVNVVSVLSLDFEFGPSKLSFSKDGESVI